MNAIFASFFGFRYYKKSSRLFLNVKPCHGIPIECIAAEYCSTAAHRLNGRESIIITARCFRYFINSRFILICETTDISYTFHTFLCVCVHMAVRAKIKSSMLVLITHISQFAKALNGSHYFSLYQLKLIKMQDNCHCNAHSVAFHFRITRLILGHDWSITTGNPLKLSWIHTHTNTDTLKRFPGSRF